METNHAFTIGEWINTVGVIQAVMIELELTNTLRKIKNTFAQQFKKRRNSMCYKHCASAIWVFYE